MSTDRFVRFQNEKPTLEHLKFLLEDYLGGLGEIEYEDTCWFITLPGNPSFPFKRVCPEANRQDGLQSERWFEVYVGSLDQNKNEAMGPNVDIITRLQDELVNNIAAGFAKILKRYYKAKADED